LIEGTFRGWRAFIIARKIFGIISPDVERHQLVKTTIWRKIMTTTMKLFLALSILCTAAFAGDQGNGGLVCDPNYPEQCCNPDDPAQQCGGALMAEDPSFMETITIAVFDEVIDAATAYGK
jgi:hypothetical protein